MLPFTVFLPTYHSTARLLHTHRTGLVFDRVSNLVVLEPLRIDRFSLRVGHDGHALSNSLKLSLMEAHALTVRCFLANSEHFIAIGKVLACL